jgi:DNA polymerase-4
VRVIARQTEDDSWACPILHVDMDAFYASVALREHPDLRDHPVIVGGGHRGVVLSANYPARAYGIRSGMSGVEARRLCPAVVALPPDFRVFEAVSRSVMEAFREVTPLVEAYSLDEAFLDVSGASRRLGSPLRIAHDLRSRIEEEQRITCSVGLARTVSVAKLASRRAKPDGVLVVHPDALGTLVHPLDVGELFGVGPKTRARLRRVGLVTVGDVAAMPLETLRHILGHAGGTHVHHLAWGTDRSSLVPRRADDDPERSMGSEETFGRDVADPRVIHRELLRLAERVSARMRRAGLAGRTVAIRVRFTDFTTISRSTTLPDPTDVTAEVHDAAVRLYDALGNTRRVRLVGVRVEGLRDRAGAQRQGVLGERDRGWPEADRAVDQVGARFGRGAVRPATLLVGDRP